MKTNTLLTFLLFIAVTHCFAQKDSLKIGETRVFGISSTEDQYKKYLPDYSPQSPNSGGLLGLQEYSVNLATGVPDISIPLYTVQEGDITLPIVLRYHAGGHRISEQASWVGWGWSLDHGSPVTRTVQGLPDDFSSNNNYLDNPILTSRDLCYNQTDFDFAEAIRDNFADVSPDIFSYSVGGKGGKFLMGQNNAEPYLIPYQPVQIKDSVNSYGLIMKFELVDTDGTEYTYGANEFGDVYTDGHYNINGRWTANYHGAWHLNKISSANHDRQIDLSYQPGGQLYQQSQQWSASITAESSGTTPLFYTNTSVAEATPTTVSNNISSVNVAKISYTDGEIEFTQSTRSDLTNAFKLDQMHVYNYVNGVKTLMKVIEFSYSYFKDALNSDGRLKLDKVTFRDGSNQSPQEYHFDYFTSNYSWTDDLSYQKKQDHFGYYNGKNNQSLIGLSSYNVGTSLSPNNISITYGGADRSTVNTYIKEGVLASIVSPLQGVTVFDFENNKFKHDGSEYLAGGLRVKSISRYADSTSIPLVKRFQYASSDGIGIGKLSTNWTPSSSNVITEQHLHYSNSAPAGSTGDATQYIITANGQLEIGSFDSAPVYYTDVTEFFENDTISPSNGYNKYTFSFTPDLIVSSPFSHQRGIYTWKRGNMLSQKTYDKDDNLVSSNENIFSNSKESTKLAAGYVNSSFIYNGDNSTSVSCTTGIINYSTQPEISYYSYSYNTGQSKLISSISTTDSVTVSQSFSFDDYLLPDTTTTTFPYSSKERQSINIYPTHNIYASNVVADSMVSRNMVGVPLGQIETESYGGSPSIYFRKKNVFDFFSGNNARALTNNILPKETWVDLMGDGLEKRVDFVEYDIDGNLLEYMVDSVSTAFAYGYNNKLVIAKAERSTREDLEDAFDDTSASETDFETTTLNTAQLTDISDMRTSLGNTRQLTWYSHIPHVGVSEIISPKGMIQTFEYDNFQRLLQIKDDDGNISSRYQYHYADSLPSLCDIDPPVLVTTTIDTCFITLEASGCSGTVNWNTGATGNTLLVSSGTVNSYSATCTEGTCTSANSNTLSLPELYQGWNIAELGSPPLDGCVYHNDGTITLSSSGSGPAGTSDQFNYVYKSITADSMVFMARLESITDSPDENMRSGLMIRTSTASNAAYYEIIYDEKNEALGLLGRSSNGGTSTFIGFNFDTVPLWLRIKKKGNEISTWVSSNANPSWSDDGQWVQIGATQTNTIFNSGFLYGLDAYNGNYGTNSLINTSTFSNISIHTF